VDCLRRPNRDFSRHVGGRDFGAKPQRRARFMDRGERRRRNRTARHVVGKKRRAGVDRNLDSPRRQRHCAIWHLERRRRHYHRQNHPGHAAASDKQRSRRILARRQPARELVAKISLPAAAPLENPRGSKVAANWLAENRATQTCGDRVEQFRAAEASNCSKVEGDATRDGGRAKN